MTNNYCRMPFEGLDISPQGEIKPCCKFSKTIATNIHEYYNSTDLAQLKQSILNNERHPGCNRCWSDEDAGSKSKRNWINEELEHIKESDTTKILSVAFSNSCNLACRTCGSYSSSRWAIEEQATKNTIKIHPHYKGYKDTNFIDAIKKVGEDAISIEFAGGEPFLTGQKAHLEFLESLPAGKSLRYITNCTKFPREEYWDQWKKFKRVDIQLSLDGVGDKFEYMRWPGNWNEAYSNIQKYKEREFGNIKLTVGHTVSILNVYYVDEFLSWCNAEGFNDVYVGVVQRPIYFDIRSLPEEIKRNITLIQPESQKVISFMNSNQLLNNGLIHNINIQDERRKQKYSEIFPEFAKIMGL